MSFCETKLKSWDVHRNEITLALHGGISRACMKKEFIREPGKRVSKTAEIYSDDLVLFFSFVCEYFPFVDINVFFWTLAFTRRVLTTIAAVETWNYVFEQKSFVSSECASAEPSTKNEDSIC